MGLDVVEMLMDLEDHFRLTIPDAEAQRLHSVGDLYVYLLARTGRPATQPCPTSRAFYRFRRALTGELGVERSRVCPAVPLRDLLTAETAATAWPRVAATLGLREPPDLNPPPRGPSTRSFKIAL